MPQLTKQLIRDYLSQHSLMQVATYGEDHPWIATVYYSFDDDLNLYFLSDPATLHARQIDSAQGPAAPVAVAVTDSHQKPFEKKKGLQLWGTAHQISDAAKVKHALGLWKEYLQVTDETLTYQNMVKKAIKGRMYQIAPRTIKFFNQELFEVTDGQEPTLEL